MTESTITIISPEGATHRTAAEVDTNGPWLDKASLQQATGFELKPEGLCRDELCYPIPPGRESEFVRESRVNLAAFWRHHGGAVVATENGDTWLLGEPADQHSEWLDTLKAPDFTLPDASGAPHSLSDYRGKKVFLTTWASWCGCRLDLKVWERLYQEVDREQFTVIAVALDSAPGAAEPWIDLAKPTYPTLIDRDHRVAELYNLVNVPQGVWIDEDGTVVRPPETAGAFDFLNKRDPDDAAKNEALNAISKETRLKYLAALKDWVANGDESEFAYSEAEVRARMTAADTAIMEAHANFRLGQYLIAHERGDEATAFLDEAKRLHPDSWAIWRQAADKLENGIAAGPEFSARVSERAKANKPYYAPIDMAGLPG